MAYKALYRTYRPATFLEVAGQNHIKKTLQNALKANKISHAYLFSGPRGIGKTTIARLLAKAVNCANAPTKEPCNQCASCLSIMYNQSTDIIEQDAASNNGVEEIRQMLEKVNYLPSNSKFKVYIIDEVHMLSTSAFNALLKTLEEPPSHVIFILATTEAHKIPMTIISRCQRFDFKALSAQEIKTKLIEVTKRENIKVKDDALDAIAETAEGGMRDALSTLDQAVSYSDDVITIDDVNSVTGRVSNYKLIELVKSFEGGNAATALQIIDEVLELGKEVNRLVGGLLTFCRDILLYKNTTDRSVFKYIFDNPEFKALANRIDRKRIYYYVDVIMDIQNKLRYSNSPRIYLEVGIMKIINMTDEELDLSNKMRSLEQRIESFASNGPERIAPVSTQENHKIETVDAKVNKLIQEFSKANIYDLNKKVTELSLMMWEEEPLNQIKNELTLVKEQLERMKDKESKESGSVVSTEEENSNETTRALETFNESLNKIAKEFEAIKEGASGQGEWKDQMIALRNDIEKLSFEVKTARLSPKEDGLFQLENEVSTDALFNRIERLENEEKNLLVMIENIASLEREKPDFSQQLEEIHAQIDENAKLLAELNLKTTVEETNTAERIDYLKLTIKDILSKINTRFDQIAEKETMIDKLDVKLAQTAEVTRRISGKISELEGKIQIVQSDSQSTLTMFENITKSETTKKEEPVKSEVVLKEKNTESVVVEKAKPPRKEERPDVVKKEEANNQNPYDIDIIERILHNSRSEEARNDRNKVMSEWKTLDKGISVSLTKVAQLLMSATVSAIGKNEIIITYPSVSLCNHVMGQKVKEDANLVFKIKFGKTMNYIALPTDLWNEKRAEYIGQYNMGVRFPKLKPLDNPDLRVIEEVQSPFLTEKNKAVEKAKSLFGDGFIKIEE